MTAVTVVVACDQSGTQLTESVDSVLGSVGVCPEVVLAWYGAVDSAPTLGDIGSVPATTTEPCGSLVEALNAGFALAASEHVAVLQAGDIYGPSHLRDSLRRLAGNQADICLAEPLFLPSKEGGHDRADGQRRAIRRYGRALSLVSYKWFGSVSSMTMRQSCWKRLGGFYRYRQAYDLDLVLRSMGAGDVIAFLDHASWEMRVSESEGTSDTWDELSAVLRRSVAGRERDVPDELLAVGYGPALSRPATTVQRDGRAT